MEDPTERLRLITEQASALSRHEAEELYGIIKHHGHTMNQNGVFVNLSLLPPDVLDSIESFMRFSHDKRDELDRYDRMRETLRASTNAAVQPLRATQFTLEVSGQKPAAVSVMRRESLKFQLLKKRYAKPRDAEGYANPELTYDGMGS